LLTVSHKRGDPWKGPDWDLVMVPRLHVRLVCGHVVEVPKSWVMKDGRVSAALQCNAGLCRRVTYDVVLDGWEATQ
jgi:hypothetical protein